MDEKQVDLTKCIKLDELARRTNFSARTLMRYYTDSDMPVIKRPHGVNYLFDYDAVYEWLVANGKIKLEGRGKSEKT